jgi:CRISPR-associated exonuclease Cas4
MTMFTEDELLPLSALQHLVFCERQAALIHLERVWADSPATVEGSHLHRTTDAGQGESRGDVRITRGLGLRSLRLGVSGRADVVEFHRVGADGPVRGVELPGVRGSFQPFPVEYKRGRPKRTHRADEAQLCAQAMCLEEMLDTTVPRGALFYGRTRHRVPVEFDTALRELTEQAAKRLHDLFSARVTPAAVWGRKCRECSLLDICQPRAGERSAARYVEKLFMNEGDSPEEEA